ncbi:MAG: hypothetical protein WCD04_06415 [Terriglobia bacterium]|jgi:hypothetical protein
MKTAFVLSVVVGATLLSAPAQAKEASQTATIVTMNSVPCGGHPMKNEELPCHEYVLRSGSTEYHIQQKVEKKADLLALGQQVTFTIHDHRMRLHATNTSGKSKDFDFALVLITAASDVNPPSAAQQ